MRFAWLFLGWVLLVSATAEAQGPEAAPPGDAPAVEPAPEAPPQAPTAEASPTEGDAPAADADVPPPPDAEPASEGPSSEEPSSEATPAATPADAPKVAVIVVGDPDDRLRALARRVDASLEPTLRRPFDPGLRAALRGEPGESDDGLEDARRERRRLGGAEATDAPLLSSLGRRAGALVVGVVRATTEGGVELVVLDVHHSAFYEGALALDDSIEPERVVSFLRRRARAAAHVESITPEAVAAAVTPDPAAEEPEEEEDEPDFFEQYWPYMVAALLLAGMITAIIATQATQQDSVPVLRFTPGGG
ncbi:MAG: hypothetical protein H6719_32595 [Sandaracinaceae bacterium]|nr:hypothetical protein [Sandaracinaceae bacterium]